ncbi:hypothetical protein ZWY2020_011426 [Hordeum vulgare]|nr:hypothetical protein ZWY2020_011426 [Hordeum vulgare]
MKLAGHGLLLVFLILLQGGVAHSKWYVGDQKGWTFGVMGWPNFKPFREGDVLECDNGGRLGFEHTLGTLSAMVSDSTRIRLSRGLVNFISGVSDNCYKGGVKITLTVRA